MKCKYYNRLRQQMHYKVRNASIGLLHGSEISKFAKLMASDNEIVIRSVADFLWDAFKLRNEVLEQPVVN